MMTNLILVLVVLFAALAIVVKVSEKFAKPVDEKQQSKLSFITLLLMVGLLLAALFQQFFKG